MTRTVYVVDEDAHARASLQSLLSAQANLLIRGYRSGDAFVEDSDTLDPGVLLLDMHVPGASGLDVLRAIGRHDARFAAVALTGPSDVALAVQAMKAGAIDVLEKPYDGPKLLQVMETAFARFEQDHAAACRTATARAKIERLSTREHDVLLGLIAGWPNKVIAHELNLSPRTVEIYRANLMEKLEVRSLPDALRIAYVAGLLPDEA